MFCRQGGVCLHFWSLWDVNKRAGLSSLESGASQPPPPPPQRQQQRKGGGDDRGERAEPLRGSAYSAEYGRLRSSGEQLQTSNPNSDRGPLSLPRSASPASPSPLGSSAFTPGSQAPPAAAAARDRPLREGGAAAAAGFPAMGLDADPVDPALQCRLCGLVLEEPLSTPCGHVFCAGCLLPWAARRRLCPLRCRPISRQELHRVAPLRSLVLRLAAQCDYRARGCRRRVPLHQLAAHVEGCAYAPGRCRRREALHMRGGGGEGPQERQQQQQEDDDDDDEEEAFGAGDEGSASRSSSSVLRARSGSAGLQQRRESESALLGQLAALQSDVQLAALRYKQKFSQYVRHLSGSHDGPEERESKILTIMLHRENNTLGFNIVGGQANQVNRKNDSVPYIYLLYIYIYIYYIYIINC
ncbi:domain-containing RING finger 4 isoform X1 [Podarcis lilfordi]|uniref:Domain-containing RING finger 4 isoform X1 n=1 Tax=Podarcis lilfordi TaxID=74358 RepID=A0AA35PGV7_9SAUR|nr:domain-containing RING finger 4 isoform X1 [Podarcis lilfordi]